MKNTINNAKDVKPKFNEIKKVWHKMLNKYFDDKGQLIKDCVIDVNCPFCDEKQYHNKFILNGFTHVRCDKCYTVYVTPRLKDEYVDLLYSDEYYSELYINSMIPAFETRKALIGQRKYKQVEHYANKGSVLDIGCGIGEVIDVFNDNEWDCHAIEFNPGALNWLRQKEINVTDVHFNEYNTKLKFDVIMAWGVVEHVLDPLNFLKKVHKLLKPGGIFVSEVPHGNSLLVDYSRVSGKDPERILMGEQHIVLYSVDAYRDLHRKAGLEQVHLQTNGLDVSTILNINQSEMAQNIVTDMQNSIDEKLYGDLLRGFWIKNEKI